MRAVTRRKRVFGIAENRCVPLGRLVFSDWQVPHLSPNPLRIEQKKKDAGVSNVKKAEGIPFFKDSGSA